MLVAEDDADTAEAVGQLVATTPGLALAGWAAHGRQAVALARVGDPDVVLMDLRMPGTDGIAATRMLAAGRRDGRPRVLVLTAFAADTYVVEALVAGASGFLPKSAAWEEVVTAIVAVSQGGAVVPPVLLRRLLDSVLPAGAAPDLSVISPREREVLALVGQGRTNDEIAAALYVSVATVKTHVARLRDELGVRDRVGLALAARAGGADCPRPRTMPDCTT